MLQLVRNQQFDLGQPGLELGCIVQSSTRNGDLNHVGLEQLNGGKPRSLEAARQCLGLGDPVVQVTLVECVLELLGRTQLHLFRRSQVMLGDQLFALVVGQLLPVGIGRQ